MSDCEFVTHAVSLEILQDVGLHLQLRRADKENLDSLELRQQIGQRAGGASAIELADEGDAEAVERALAINRVQVEQGLRGMLPAVAIVRH